MLNCRYKLGDFVEKALGKTIAYARVSSHDQKSDLDRQDAVLSSYCAAIGWSYEVAAIPPKGSRRITKDSRKASRL